MDAIIVAAGESSRLYPRTLETPKCLLEVGGERLIDRSLRLLEEAGVNKVYVVVGFKARKLEKHLGERVEFIYNPFYASTNNMASLWMALRKIATEELIYLHSDLIFEEEILFENLKTRSGARESLVVDSDSVHEEAMKVRLEGGRFVESSKEIPSREAAGEWIGMTFFSSAGTDKFENTALELLLKENFNAYDTAAFNRMARADSEFEILDTGGKNWKEIDNEADLEEAREMFG